MSLGDFDTSSVVYFKFTTFRPSTGAPFTLAGTPALSVYKDNSTTQTTTGVTLTVDFDGVTGLNHVAVDTSDAFYAAGSFFDVVITTGTVDSVSAVGTVVGRFTLRKTACLKPTTSGRTLDVSSGGEAGIDFANIGSPTTTVNLSGTTISTSQVVASVTGAVGSVTGAVGSVTGNVGGNVVGSVASVTARVTANTDQWNGVSVTGMPLPTASYTAPLDAAGTRAAVGLATANLDTQLDALPTAAENADAVWDEAYSGHTTAGTFGKLMDTLRKANYVTEGSVAAGGTPTTTVFRTNLTEPTGTFDNQTLLFISGDLSGESAPIEAYSVTNGQITLGDALTQAPTAADEFVVLPDHVHPIGEIADGVLTRQMTEAYRAAGVAPTLAQVAFELIAHMGDSSISGTTKTLKKLDGTAAKTFTLDSATTPTSITEAT
jgi:hypothetical protein